MDLKQLNYFVTIVNEGNISNAAKKLHMSQPPLSTQIHLLEDELGCVLFERGSRQIQLTEAGKLLYNRALTLLEMSDILKSELADYNNGTHGTLRIGVISSVSYTLLNNWLQPFHIQYPHIHFELLEANTYELLEQLKSNRIEVAIVRTPFLEGSFECTYLSEEPMLAIGSSTFFLDIPDDSITLTQLSQKPLILYRRWEKILQELFRLENIHPNIFCINDDARTTTLWADAGLGVGIIPASTVSLIKQPDTIYKTINDTRLYSKISMIHNKNSYLSVIAKTFIDFIQNH